MIGVEPMTDCGVALAWIALTVASAKGLAAFARVTARSRISAEDDLALLVGEEALAVDGMWLPILADRSRTRAESDAYATDAYATSV
jgi:hypothetical protein